ncbi:MAG: M24 family metallopeptidase [Candidatus Beckwithbacteria bacterium]|nr:M24 family metallopeptidase [Candidatus Beckwithbacteria bacterium]
MLDKVCEKTRATASEALLKVIRQIWGKSFSERQLKDLWMEELRKSERLFPSGWYCPPPEGCGVLIGNENNPGRLNYDTLRKEGIWPQANIKFNIKTGLAYIFASPVDKETGIIGDFGLTVYAGKDKEIINHFKRVYLVNQQIVGEIRSGLKVSEVYNKAIHIFSAVNLTNNVRSSTDIVGTNIGHSIPGTLDPYSETELAVIKSDNWQAAGDLISQKRVFFNGKTDYVFKPGDCFTLEPRLTDLKTPNLPMVSFHTIMRVTADGAELIENFDKIFLATKMDYMVV